MLRGVSRRCVPPPPLTTNNGYASGAKSPSGQALEGSESSDIGIYHHTVSIKVLLQT